MEFNDDDSEQEKAMKFRLIDIYNHKLDERIMRKEFIISRKLLDIKEQMRLDKARTKEEKEIHNLMKVLARFNTPEDHEKLVQDIIKEKQLRQRIAELRELQARGVKTWGEVEEELDGKKKKDDKNKKKDENLPADKVPFLPIRARPAGSPARTSPLNDWRSVCYSSASRRRACVAS